MDSLCKISQLDPPSSRGKYLQHETEIPRFWRGTSVSEEKRMKLLVQFSQRHLDLVLLAVAQEINADLVTRFVLEKQVDV